MAALVHLLPVPGADPSTVLDVFAAWANDGGRPLYSHQEEASLAPHPATMSCGDADRFRKSLVAVAGIVLCAERRVDPRVWTAPSAPLSPRVLRSVDLLGAEQFGLATGDASINPARRSVRAARAEVLANHALAHGAPAASASHASTSTTTTPIAIEAGLADPAARR